MTGPVTGPATATVTLEPERKGKAKVEQASALYDPPGPRALARHRLYGILALVVFAGILAWIGYKLVDTGQFAADKWNPFTYQGIQDLLLRGLGNTLRAFVWAAVLSLALGTVLAAGRLSDHRVVRWAATAVVEFFRAMPVLVMIFFVFVALKTEPRVALITGLTLYNGSVLAEVFRAGVHAVPRGQREAAYALGMRKTQVMTYVLIPQGVRTMLPAIVSQLVVALKDTSLGYLISYEEFLYAGKQVATNLDYGLPFIPVVMVIAPVYIGMCMLLSGLATWLDRRGRRSARTSG
ncbi:amino acid ABC transporter permease [Yinghuangia seranimata]|uniref:amino acid ABC transporter permease n=1 Tax=Yinghuangia seranimata TaxID=408067 RepID=UPI00248C57C5|nr:amino acid ABC transporter permease [Yinghuangia seranimata]MDI2126610.1 amino acid ABC transporter permease [Yinghuangia seranimata]